MDLPFRTRQGSHNLDPSDDVDNNPIPLMVKVSWPIHSEPTEIYTGQVWISVPSTTSLIGLLSHITRAFAVSDPIHNIRAIPSDKSILQLVLENDEQDQQTFTPQSTTLTTSNIQSVLESLKTTTDSTSFIRVDLTPESAPSPSPGWCFGKSEGELEEMRAQNEAWWAKRMPSLTKEEERAEKHERRTRTWARRFIKRDGRWVPYTVREARVRSGETLAKNRKRRAALERDERAWKRQRKAGLDSEGVREDEEEMMKKKKNEQETTTATEEAKQETVRDRTFQLPIRLTEEGKAKEKNVALQLPIRGRPA